VRRKQPANLSTMVTEKLGRRIVAGKIAPGEPIPTEAALCTSLGVSRTTVREAMKRLHG
jgi:DNA-binding FadR family transcriptional regulator